MRTKYFQKRESGPRFKRTPQRLAILDYLEGNTSHPSAEDIHRSVSKRYQSLSVATVYNTVNTLVKTGSLRELTIDPERKRYDPDTSGHHHFICTRCGMIMDVPEGIAIDLPVDSARDFSILGFNVDFYGHCSVCKKTKNLSSVTPDANSAI